jgi:hypothetical protein
MAGKMKSHTILADSSGVVYAQAELTQAGVDRLIKEYKRAGIELQAYGSPDQLIAQLDAINSMLDANETARAMRESGRLQVIAC